MDNETQHFLEQLGKAAQGDPASLEWAAHSIEARQTAAKLRLEWHNGGIYGLVNWLRQDGAKRLVETLADREQRGKR